MSNHAQLGVISEGEQRLGCDQNEVGTVKQGDRGTNEQARVWTVTFCLQFDNSFLFLISLFCLLVSVVVVPATVYSLKGNCCSFV